MTSTLARRQWGSAAVWALVQGKPMLIRRPGDRFHHRAATGAMNAVLAGLLVGVRLPRNQAIPLRDKFFQIECGNLGDLFPLWRGKQRRLVFSVRVPVNERMKEDVGHGKVLAALTGSPSESKKRLAQKSSAS